MKSLFTKHFFVYTLVIIFGFVLLGSTFIYQINRVTNEEKLNLLDNTVERVKSYTEDYVNTSKIYNLDLSRLYMNNLHQMAYDCDGYIFVGSPQGRLMYVATPDGCYYQDRGELPANDVAELLGKSEYTHRISNFSGLLTGNCFLQGATAEVGAQVQALIFVAIPPNSVLYQGLSQSFILITMIVLLLVLIVSIVVVRSLVKPLSEMALVARGFARGDFSARVPLPERQDELYEVTVSFNSMANAMENTEYSRRELVASVSHDLRTPLTTIGGFVDGMLDGTIKPENQERYLRIISDEVKRLSRMANSMVEVSRLESGEREMVKSKFDMSELIRRVLISFEQKLTEKGIEVALDIPDEQIIAGDHDSLFQVMYNLMDNAVKFTDIGGTITVYMAEKAGSVEVRVINTGGEIRQEDLKNIFNRFFKGDQSRNTSGSGSGLGLYIAKTVINRHGGDVYASCKNGKTEFCFNIPSGAK